LVLGRAVKQGVVVAVRDGPSEWAVEPFADGLSFEQLVALPGTKFTSVAMQIVRQRAARVEVPRLLGRYLNNRFVRPTPAAALAVRRIEDAFIASACGPFELVALAPLVPFATHAQLTGISQNRVVTTLRDAEVAGDPTVGLTLEAAARCRSALGMSQAVRVAAVQRITRAQRFTAPDSFAHFTLGALVTVTRARRVDRFEVDALREHVTTYVRMLHALGHDDVQVAVSDFADRPRSFADQVAGQIEDDLGITGTVDIGRTTGRDYYSGLCIKITVHGGELEVGDGGTVDWAAQLTQSLTERCFTTGISIERLALHPPDL
jgi:hypothetical protein